MVRKILEYAAKNGYTAYAIKGHDSFGYLITPKGNVLAVTKAQWGKGVNFSFEYKANRKCGRGCSCHNSTDEWYWGLLSVTTKGIEELEAEGYKFARQLKAPLYKSADEWKTETMWADSLIRL